MAVAAILAECQVTGITVVHLAGNGGVALGQDTIATRSGAGCRRDGLRLHAGGRYPAYATALVITRFAGMTPLDRRERHLAPRQRREVFPRAGHCFRGGAALRQTRCAQTVASLNQPRRENKAWPLCLSGKPPSAAARMVEPAANLSELPR